MEQVGLVEPHMLAGARVGGHGLAHLARAKLAVGLPLAGDTGLAAEALDRGAVRRAKHLLPGDIQAVTVVAHVHHLLHREALPYPAGTPRKTSRLSAIGVLPPSAAACAQ